MLIAKIHVDNAKLRVEIYSDAQQDGLPLQQLECAAPGEFYLNGVLLDLKSFERKMSFKEKLAKFREKAEKFGERALKNLSDFERFAQKFDV